MNRQSTKSKHWFHKEGGNERREGMLRSDNPSPQFFFCYYLIYLSKKDILSGIQTMLHNTVTNCISYPSISHYLMMT